VVAVRNVYIFPGIPEVVQRKFERIREQFRQPPYILRRVFLRADEGQIAEDLRAVLRDLPDLQLGSYPVLHNPEYTVMLTLESKSPEVVEGALRHLLTRLPNHCLVRIE
jgi:FAD synthetase